MLCRPSGVWHELSNGVAIVGDQGRETTAGVVVVAQAPAAVQEDTACTLAARHGPSRHEPTAGQPPLKSSAVLLARLAGYADESSAPATE